MHAQTEKGPFFLQPRLRGSPFSAIIYPSTRASDHIADALIARIAYRQSSQTAYKNHLIAQIFQEPPCFTRTISWPPSIS